MIRCAPGYAFAALCGTTLSLGSPFKSCASYMLVPMHPFPLSHRSSIFMYLSRCDIAADGAGAFTAIWPCNRGSGACSPMPRGGTCRMYVEINTSRTVGEYVLISVLHATTDMVEEEVIRGSAIRSRWIHAASIGSINDVYL